MFMDRILGLVWRTCSIFLLAMLLQLFLWISLLHAAVGKLDVVVSILPQKYFVDRIGGDKVNCSVIVQPGADPATYEPRPRQMAFLAKANLYFSIGVPFEQAWLKRFSQVNPKLMIVPVQDGIRLYPVSENKSMGEKIHGRATGMMDPHIWLSPPLVMLQARNILDALVHARPAYAAYFQANYLALVQLVARTDMKIMDMLMPEVAGKSKPPVFMVFHPCWGYFARAYGLRQVAIQEAGREPGARRLAELVSMARRLGVVSIFVQPQFSSRSAKAIADSVGASLVPLDPLAYDWDRNLIKVATRIRESLR